jgi:catecholate siderophore receptor
MSARKRGRSGRQDGRRPGKPPRWLVFGALAATTAFSGRAAATAEAQEFVARHEDLAGDAGAMQREGRPRPRSETYSFAIPPGPLEAALVAFEETTGLTVKIEREAIGGFISPGVSGVFSADRALGELLAGTGIVHRFTDARTVSLDLEVISETLDVTATPAPMSPKYTAPLRDIPQTLTVIPHQLIEQQGATTLRDVLRNVTGISIQAGEGGGGLPGDNLSIRGFAARNDVFVDGVRDFGAYSRDPFNIEQVEVSKGPGSIYGGRGSTGGSLNVSSKTPQLRTLQGGTLGIGGDNFTRATFDVNQSLGDFGISGAAVRVNAMWTHADTPGRDAVENQRWGIAPSIAFGLGKPTRVTVSYSHLAQDNVPDYGIPWVPAANIPLAGYADQAPPVDFDNFYGLESRDYEETVTGIGTAMVEHDFNDSISLRSLLRYGQSTRDSIITAPRFVSNDSTSINRQIQSRDLEDTILAQQNDLTVRFQTGGIGHALVTGVEIARETSENHSRSGPTAPVADLFNPDPGDPYTGPITRTGARTESTADTAALYVSDTVDLTGRWQLTGGLRWDRFSVDYESIAVGGAVTPFERTDEMLSWRAGVVHKPLPNGSVYASLGTSFNPSAEGNTGLSLTDATVRLEPEKSRGYEVGTKWDLFGERLSLNAALFRTEKTNVRTPGINPGDPPTVLEGEQRVDGFELGASGNLTDRWSGFFGYTYMESEIVKSNTAAEVGNELANTPDHSLSLWTAYRLPWGLEMGGGVQYVGDRFNNNTSTRVAPGYWLFDAMAAWRLNSRFALRLNINNLADERYIDRVGGGHFIPGTGRSVLLTTDIDF